MRVAPAGDLLRDGLKLGSTQGVRSMRVAPGLGLTPDIAPGHKVRRRPS